MKSLTDLRADQAEVIDFIRSGEDALVYADVGAGKTVMALTAAQTKVAEATAVTKNVEGMYSATTAANLVASNPLIAPSSDQILMSAGFVDADASPIIAPVNAPALDIQENTNPMTPPNPDVGVNQGIESGGL